MSSLGRTHKGLPYLDKVQSQQNTAVPTCRAALSKDSAETVGCYCVLMWGRPSQKEQGADKTLQWPAHSTAWSTRISGAAQLEGSVDLEKLCGTPTPDCSVWSEWGAALCAPMPKLLPTPRREFKVMCASDRRKGRVSRALSHRQAEWPCPDPAMAVHNLSNGAHAQGCLWSERGVAEPARSCPGQKGSRTSQVLRCTHISLPQREGWQSCWGLQMQAHKATPVQTQLGPQTVQATGHAKGPGG